MKSLMHSKSAIVPLTAVATLMLAGCQTANNPSPRPAAQIQAPVTQASARPAATTRRAAPAARVVEEETRDSDNSNDSSDSDSDSPGGGGGGSWN